MSLLTKLILLAVVAVCLVSVADGKKGKGKGKGKFKGCISHIHRDKRHVVNYPPGTKLPWQRTIHEDTTCFDIECSGIGKKPVWMMVPPLSGNVGTCDSCKDGDVEYGMGTIRKFKHALPAPCWSEVCTYPNVMPYPSGKPTWQKFGHACDCPHPASSKK